MTSKKTRELVYDKLKKKLGHQINTPMRIYYKLRDNLNDPMFMTFDGILNEMEHKIYSYDFTK